jgi:hypothetical protein
MMTVVHDHLDNYLAADLHGELSGPERDELNAHLLECAHCRRIHRETRAMNKILEETLTQQKPDPAFEQRMLAGFHKRIPLRRGGFGNLIVDLIRSRGGQAIAAVALLLVLVQVGGILTYQARPAYRRSSHFATAGSGEDRLAPFANAVLGPRQSGTASSEGESKMEVASAENDVSAFSKLKRPPAAPSYQRQLQMNPNATPAPVSAVPAPPPTEVAETSTALVAEGMEPNAAETPSPALANRKLIRNATVELEIVSFDNAVKQITAFATEEHGYVATTNSDKQANGKLRGQVAVKVLPENLDRFLQKVRGLGELKNQALGTEDVTKAYFDTDARLKNARVMEQRLIEMLKTKTGKVSDLLEVEKELGRVREQIEKMQGELKYWDSQVQFATVTISLAEKDMEEPAAFLLKEHAQLALYAPDVEKIYNDIKALASPKVQITNAQLNRDYSGRVSAQASMLVAPEESDAVVGRVKGFGRVENFQTQTERIAQGGSGISENAKTKRDKVELNITVSRDEQEQALQQTSLRIRTSSVDEKAKELRALAEKQGGRVRSSTFNRDPDGRELANVWLRVPMKNYASLMQSLNSLGRVENVSVQRQNRTDAQIDEANAPADVSIEVYSQGNIISHETGLFPTLRRTLTQSAGAIMWSLRMIGVAVAFLAPWAIAIVAAIWIARRVIRARR